MQKVPYVVTRDLLWSKDSSTLAVYPELQTFPRVGFFVSCLKRDALGEQIFWPQPFTCWMKAFIISAL